MFIVFIYVSISQHVYKVKYLNMLEYSFYLNLGISSTASLYTSQNQAAVTYTSVGIAFVTFCAIVLYHTVIRITTLCQQNHCMCEGVWCVHVCHVWCVCDNQTDILDVVLLGRA